MRSDPIPPDLRRRMQILQIIWLALMVALTGVLVVFALVHQPVVPGDAGPGADAHGPAEQLPLSLLFAGIGVAMMGVALVLPEQLAAKMPATFETYQVSRIIQAALLEGPGMMQGVAYLMEGQWWSLALGSLSVVLLLALLPTRDKATRWLQRRSMSR